MCTITDLQPLRAINCACYEIIFQGVHISGERFQQATGFNVMSPQFLLLQGKYDNLSDSLWEM